MHCPPRCPSATLTPATIALTRFAAAQRGAAAAASDATAAATAAASTDCFAGVFAVTVTGAGFTKSGNLACKFDTQIVLASYIDASTLLCVTPPQPSIVGVHPFALEHAHRGGA